MQKETKKRIKSPARKQTNYKDYDYKDTVKSYKENIDITSPNKNH